jgi:two-component system, cell cycle response regulator DivK
MARVLVVEDNPQNLKLTTIILQSAGHTVTGVVNSVEAERALAGEIPDLIVMDVALPGKDGYALTRELRHRPATARLPILALSAFAMPGDAEKALNAGCSDYLTKPVRRAVLLERVDRLLAAAGPRRGTAAPPAGSDPETTAPNPPEATPDPEWRSERSASPAEAPASRPDGGNTPPSSGARAGSVSIRRMGITGMGG